MRYALLLALLLPVPEASAWSWNVCREGLKTSGCSINTCGRREANKRIVAIAGSDEVVRNVVADLLEIVDKKVQPVMEKESKLLKDVKSAAKGAPTGINTCLENAADKLSVLEKGFKKIHKGMSNIIPWCREKLGDPETEKYAKRCEPEATDAHTGYQTGLKTIKAVQESLSDIDKCPADVEDEAAVASFNTIVPRIRSEQDAALEELPKG